MWSKCMCKSPIIKQGLMPYRKGVVDCFDDGVVVADFHIDMQPSQSLHILVKLCV